MFELAARSGYERSNLRRIEAGKIVNLAHHNIRKLADALDADIEDFYDAIWQDTQEPLPSLPIYFRHRYRDLTTEQIAEIERIVTDMHNDNTTK